MSKNKDILSSQHPGQKMEKNGKGFSTALLFNLAPLQNSLFEMSEGVENQRLNTSASAVPGDSSSMINDFLSSDLMQKIDQLSPISSNRHFKSRMSDVELVNCEDNNSSQSQDDLLDSSSEELELKEDVPFEKKIKKKSKKNTKVTFGISSMEKDKKSKTSKLNKSYTARGLDQENMALKCQTGSKNYHSRSFHSRINDNSKNRLFSYYDSTSKYLSQALLEEQEKNENKLFDSLDNSHNYIPKTKCNGKDIFQFDYINSKKESSQNEEINNSNYYDNNPSKFFTSAQPENHDSFNKFNFSNEQVKSEGEIDQQEQQEPQNQQPILNNQPFDYWNQYQVQNLNNNFNQNNIFTQQNQDIRNKMYFDMYNQFQMLQQQRQNQIPQNRQEMHNYFDYMGMMVNNPQNQFDNMQPMNHQIQQNSTNVFQPNNVLKKNKKNNKKAQKKKAPHGNSNNGEDESNSHFPTTYSTENSNIDRPEEYLLEMFGRIGWICNQCNNFNYETRNKCNRCGVNKNPKKLSEMRKKKERSENSKEKKKNKEHKGDWICPQCTNLNFGFRKICNRCQIPREEAMANTGCLKDNNVIDKDFQRNYPMQLINNGQININYNNSSNNKLNINNNE